MSDEILKSVQSQSGKVSESKRPDLFKKTSTEQANQLRIALIGISLGLCAFFAKEINKETTFSQSPYLYGTVLLSLLASGFGLSAWKFSARMFHEMGDEEASQIEKGFNHRAKVYCDYALAFLLGIAVVAAFAYLVVERNPVNSPGQKPLEPLAVFIPSGVADPKAPDTLSEDKYQATGADNA